ncbi:MAG: hypothetical protein IKZ89_07045 [Bacteroidaceae bacterium]|nr:hypothetical protein [Bacteroidaceae bacterium]
MTPVSNNKSKGLYGNILRLLPYILALLLWAVLALRGQIFLKKVEDLSLFLFDWLYFREYIQIPGGLLGVAGSFLTQFLYLPWLGSILWVLLLLITYQLTVRVLRIPEQYRALAIIPAALLVIGNMSLGYGVFIMREQDHFFAPLLGYLAALIPISGIYRVEKVWGKMILLAIWTAVGFPLFGTFALIGTLSAACTAFTATDMLRKNRIGLFLTGVALIILIPVIIYNFYTSYRLADSWHLGLPSISEDVWTHAIRAPFQLALLFIPVMTIASRWLKESGKTLTLQTAVFVISVASVWGFWFKDENFRTELAMSEAVDRFDWQKVIDIYQKTVDSHTESDAKAYAARSKALSGVKSQEELTEILGIYDKRFFEPTRTMILYRDLALLKMNRALDEAFTMKDGGRMQKSRTQIPMALQSGKQLYLQYGLVNMSYRWCLEDVIEHNWSYSTIKYMAMHSVIMQESDFARKYLNKLEKTVFYRQWAKEQGKLAADSVLMASNEPYKSILPYMCFENRMTNDLVKSETFLMRHFSEPEPPHPSPEYDRAGLLWAMRMQDIPSFWQHLYSYLQTNNVRELPRSVQEAALLYSSLEKKSTDLPLSKAVRDSYNAFNQYVNANPVRDIRESAYPFSRKFGNTFFYFYYFIRDLQTY